MEKLFT